MTERDIRIAFEHLEEDVVNNVQTEVRLAEIPHAGQPRRRLHPAFVALVGAAAVVIAIGAVALGLRLADRDPAAPTDTTTPATPTTVPDTTMPPTSVTTLPPGSLPEIGRGTVVIANPEATTGVMADGSVVIGDATLALGDGSGGVIVQRGDEILRVDATGQAATLITATDLPAELGPVTVRLEALATVAGSQQVMFIVAGGVEEQSFEEIWLHDIASGSDTSVYRTGAYEGGIRRASLRNDVLVVTRAAEGVSWFEFFNAAGDPIDVANPHEADSPGDEPVGVDQGVLSPDGSVLVYLEVPIFGDPEDGVLRNDLVVWDLVNGVEDSRLELALGRGHADRLDYDGRGVVLGLVQWTGFEWEQILGLRIESLDADAGIVSQLAHPGKPSIAR
jgi:hypothetical protein